MKNLIYAQPANEVGVEGRKNWTIELARQ